MRTAELPEGLEVALAVPSGRPVPEARIRRALARLFRRLGTREGEISVTFLADGPIRRLNRDHLDHDWVPDVLSFDLGGESGGLGARGAGLVADIYVGLDQAERQADELGVPTDEELVRLVLHGTLHVLGFDHPEEPGKREDSELWAIQEAIMAGEELPGEFGEEAS